MHARFVTLALLAAVLLPFSSQAEDTPSSVASAPKTPIHIPAMVHVRMTYRHAVIYDRTYDDADTTRPWFNVALSVGDWSMTAPTALYDVTARKEGSDHLDGQMASGEFVSFAVADLTGDGQARLVVSYTLRPDASKPAKVGSFVKEVPLGQTVKITTSEGEPVTLRVDRQHGETP